MTMNNLQLPKQQKTEEPSTQSKGLFLVELDLSQEKKMSSEPRDRIASYVATLRQARMDLKNG